MQMPGRAMQVAVYIGFYTKKIQDMNVRDSFVLQLEAVLVGHLSYARSIYGGVVFISVFNFMCCF